MVKLGENTNDSVTKRGRERRVTLYERFIKPVGDRFFGLLFGLLTLPALAVLSVVARIAFGSPGIKRTAYVGKNDTRFNLYKLRTSEPHTDDLRGRRRKLANFLREWSLDELPQFWNVAFGHMSMVGPRPVPPAMAAEFTEWESRRHEVKPGLTGLWQAEARGDGRHLADNIHYDIQYIDQLSWVTDMRILARSVVAIIFRREGSVRSTGPKKRLRSRLPHIRLITADLVVWGLALSLAAVARLDFSWAAVDKEGLLTAFIIAGALQLFWGYGVGSYRGRWRVASYEEMAWVASGAALVTVILLLTTLPNAPNLIPRGAIVGAGAFYLVGALGTRYIARAAYTAQSRSTHQRRRRLLVYGAGEAGEGAIKALWMDGTSDLEPVAFLDDDPTKQGSRALGLPVVGARADLASVARRYAADSLLVAMPSAPVSVLDDVAAAARELRLQVQVMPPLVASLSDLLVDHASQAPVARVQFSPSREASSPGVDRTTKEHDFDLAIIGLGYVGLPVAVHASLIGLRVIGLDIAEDRVTGLMAGTSYIEDVSNNSLAEALEAGFVATTDSSMLARADTITISVPTPLRDELPDLGAVISASEAVGDFLQPGQVVILESTTYPGTTEEVVQPILEQRSGMTAGTDFFLAYSPERIDPGNEEWGIHNTPKLVGGINDESTERAALLYQKFSPVVTMSGTREAEMAKLLENTYRHVNIALVNELAIFCRQLGVDIWETIRGAATKPFGFQAFYPGPGVGGHCIPIDPNYLSYRVRELGEQFRFIELAQEINEYMPSYVAERCTELLSRNGKSLVGARVLILGVAYKPDVSDTRETPATGVISALRAGGAHLEFADPHVASFEVSGIPVPRRTDVISATIEADLVVVHTTHSEFDLEQLGSIAPLMLDTRGIVSRSTAERL